MKILYISYIETNAGWGAECFVEKALKRLGQEVVSVDFKKYSTSLVERLETIDDYDVLFLQRGDWFPKEIIRASNRPCVFWASELISRCRDQDRLLYAGLFNHIFVHTEKCKVELQSKLKKSTAASCSCLINAFDEKLHRKLGVNKETDVLFIGSVTERRKIVLTELEKRLNCNIKCVENVFGEDFVEEVNKARIVLNIHSSKNLDTETRVFEVLGCGSFLLSEPLSVENPFTPGKHYVEAELDDFSGMVEYYLQHEDERERIADQGYSEAQTRHSYFARTKNDILPVLERVAKDGKHDGYCWNLNSLSRYQKKSKKAWYVIARKAYLKLFYKYQWLWDKLNVK